MKLILTLLTGTALLCGCHTETNRGAGSDNTSEVLTNSRGGSGMTLTNSQGSGASDLINTNTPSSSR